MRHRRAVAGRRIRQARSGRPSVDQRGLVKLLGSRLSAFDLKKSGFKWTGYCCRFETRHVAKICWRCSVRHELMLRQMTNKTTTTFSIETFAFQALANNRIPTSTTNSNCGSAEQNSAQDAPNLEKAGLARLCEDRNFLASNGNKSGNTDLLFTGTEITHTTYLLLLITRSTTLNTVVDAISLHAREDVF